ncbi:ATP-binding protein [Streptomyces sp. MUM 203J]|uniref:ATP-binding protein n=1 Tax=Streptomyces sp. MUM 203J TaxID=2791990 RepID=UPI001F03866D|nr:ATP-binding protein [Streptomyces sp. MUM 203J]MCH0541798.1 ATP-binding protein [Streptomyces sp. MUM 203J]
MDTVSPDPAWSYLLQLPHNPLAPRVARVTLRAVLAGHGMSDRVEVAELLASELVTNAYRYSGGPATMRLRRMEDDWLRISVWDTNPSIPAPFDRPATHLHAVPTPTATDDLGGRGLLLVRGYADDWGAHPLGDDLFGRGGKLLWCELAPQDQPPTINTTEPTPLRSRTA